jgi:stage II sporulation protein D
MPLKSDYQVRLSSENNMVIGVMENQEFQELFNLDDEYFICRLDSYYNIENDEYILAENIEEAKIGPIHIEVDKEYESYKDVIEEIEELRDDGIDAYPVYDGKFKIWIGFYPDRDSAKENIKELDDIKSDLNIIEEDDKRIILENSKGQAVLVFNVNDNIHIKSEEVEGKIPLIDVEDYRYRDFITFNTYEGQLIVINYVELNHYLYGVVAREMSFTWPLEALKAQAVAARNYAMVNKNKHGSIGYDLCDTQDCQVYGGYRWEHEKTNRAVDETENKIIKYNDKPIVAYYHSSSGGHTEDSENIWSGYVPYLRGVKDEFSLGSPNDNWQTAIEKEKVEEKLKENGVDVGEVISIKPLSYSEHGRVLELMVKGTEGIEILKKEKVRLIFGTSNIKSTWFKVKSDADVYVISGYGLSAVKSNLSELTVINGEGIEVTSRDYNRRYKITNGAQYNTVPVAPTVYVFDGRGWGHGLGMSQWGAKKMAELGYTYKEILEYYYTGTKVE